MLINYKTQNTLLLYVQYDVRIMIHFIQGGHCEGGIMRVLFLQVLEQTVLYKALYKTVSTRTITIRP